MTVQQLLRNTDSRELSEWRAFMKIRSGQSEYPKQTPEEIGQKLKDMARAMRQAKKGSKKKKRRPKILPQLEGSPTDGHDNR